MRTSARATKAEFIGRFKSFVSLTGDNAPPAPKGRNTIMPWLPFSGMTEDDLGMLYDFFKTLAPIEHKVNPFPDAEPVAPAAKAAGAEGSARVRSSHKV